MKNVLKAGMTIGFAVVWMAGCSSPSEDLCQKACENVGVVVSSSSAGEGATGIPELGNCVRTCLPQSKAYVECLSNADTLKSMRECHGDSES